MPNEPKKEAPQSNPEAPKEGVADTCAPIETIGLFYNPIPEAIPYNEPPKCGPSCACEQ